MSKCKHTWKKLFAKVPYINKRTGEKFMKRIKIGRYCTNCPKQHIVPEKMRLLKYAEKS